MLIDLYVTHLVSSPGAIQNAGVRHIPWLEILQVRLECPCWRQFCTAETIVNHRDATVPLRSPTQICICKAHNPTQANLGPHFLIVT